MNSRETSPLDLGSLIRERSGEGRCDLSQLLRHPRAFRFASETLARPFLEDSVDLVVGLEAAGLGVAGAVAYRLGSGLVLLRRPGKAAWTTRTARCRDYSGEEKTFELVSDAVHPGQRCLVVDDWSESGAQLSMAKRLIESLGAVVLGCVCIQIDPAARQHADLRGTRLVSVIDPGARTGWDGT